MNVEICPRPEEILKHRGDLIGGHVLSGGGCKKAAVYGGLNCDVDS